MSGPCLSSSVAGRPLRPATRLRLGEPLPHQLADRPRAHREVPGSCESPASTVRKCSPTVTSGISSPFSELSHVFTADYPRVTHPCATPTREYCYPLISVRLACLIHAASVRSEPESNSPLKNKSSIPSRLIQPELPSTSLPINSQSLIPHRWKN